MFVAVYLKYPIECSIVNSKIADETMMINTYSVEEDTFSYKIIFSYV